METMFTALDALDAEIEDYRKNHMKCKSCMLLGTCSEPYRFECSHPFSPDGHGTPSKAANYRKINDLLFNLRKELREI